MKDRNGMSESEAGKLGAEKSKLITAQKLQDRIKLYNQNPSTCKQCNGILPYDKRHNIFCCKSCAATYNNLARDKVIYEKSKATLHKTLSKKFPPKIKIIKEKPKIQKDTKIKDIKKYKKKENKKTQHFCKYCGQISCIYPEICKKYRIFNSLEKFGFNLSIIGTPEIKNEYNRVKSIIEQFYINHNSNDKLLKDTFGYTSGPANFRKLLKTLNIKTKSSSEAIIDSYLNGNNTPNNSNSYYEEWHKTWDNKDVFVRSSYELDYAKLLDEQKIIYEMELLRIKYYDSMQEKYRCAIPDFYLPNTNEIIEIKSIWTLKGKVQEMKDKFTEYINLGYIPKLILEHKEVNVFDLSEEYILKCKKAHQLLPLDV